jgi:CBS domain-containing protein
MKVRDFLKIKGRPVITVKPDETVSVAIQKLVYYNIGALPVCNDNGMQVGIISERDLLKECLHHCNAIDVTKIQDVMTKQVAVGVPEDDLDYVTSVMKQKKIRHLPIVVDQKLEGIISMRDIVDMQLEETKAQIRYAGLLPRSVFVSIHDSP